MRRSKTHRLTDEQYAEYLQSKEIIAELQKQIAHQKEWLESLSEINDDYRTAEMTVKKSWWKRLFPFLLFISCSERENPVYAELIHHIKTVVVLGNSITVRPPYPKIGWYSSWGMAASCIDSDFIHRLIKDIHGRDSSVIVRYASIAEFEKHWATYDLNQLDSLRCPDMLIMRISENVKDSAVVEFINHYDKLVKRIGAKLTVITDGFWPKDEVNDVIENYALSEGYPFISLTDLFTSENQALGFANHSIQRHPNDQGMRMIEESIWEYVGRYF